MFSLVYSFRFISFLTFIWPFAKSPNFISRSRLSRFPALGQTCQCKRQRFGLLISPESTRIEFQQRSPQAGSGRR